MEKMWTMSQRDGIGVSLHDNKKLRIVHQGS